MSGTVIQAMIGSMSVEIKKGEVTMHVMGEAQKSTYKITKVDKGSPGDGKLKVGDVVIEIQGVSTDEMASESEAAAWLRGPVDKAVSVVRALPDGEGFRADEMAIPRSADP